MFVLNHPNALVDPVLLIELAPRPVVFLAKEPLFRMPVIGWFVRRLGAIPVHRRSDPGADVTRNREMFARVRAELDAGGAVALFPEGTSHSDLRLRPFKTGAARIALGAAVNGALDVVPAALFYTSKATFRSGVLLRLGPPLRLRTAPDELDHDGEPIPDAVHRLTDRFEAAIGELALQADAEDAVNIATRAELLLTSGDTDDGRRLPLVEQLALRQRILAGYRRLRAERPAELARLQHRISRLESRLARVGLDAETLNYGPLDRPRALRYIMRMSAYTVFVFPVALIGLAIHFPAYRLVGPLATTVYRPTSDLIATIKIIVAALLFPLTWVLVAIGAGWWGGWHVAVAAAVAAPGAGFVALRFLERVDRFVGEARSMFIALRRPTAYRNLVHERAQLRADIIQLEAGMRRG